MSRSLSEGQRLLAGAMYEKALQEHLRQRCLVRGIRYFHTHRSTYSPAGYPDMTMIGLDGMAYAELKRVGKKPTRAQQEWIDDLRRVGLTVWIWDPIDLLSGKVDECLDTLGRRPPLARQ